MVLLPPAVRPWADRVDGQAAALLVDRADAPAVRAVDPPEEAGHAAAGAAADGGTDRVGECAPSLLRA